MINITENNEVFRDGELIGRILDDGIYASEKISGRIIGQIRDAADNPNLKVIITGSLQEEPVEEPAVEEPTVKESLSVQLPPLPSRWDTSTFGNYWENPQQFQMRFVNTYGPSEFNQWKDINVK
jgi:hypothetical protein